MPREEKEPVSQDTITGSARPTDEETEQQRPNENTPDRDQDR